MLKHAWLVVASAILVLSGCKCGDPKVDSSRSCAEVPGHQPGNDATCTSDSACGDHYACVDVQGSEGLKCCMVQDRACNTEADCCPGQTCPSERKKCFDKAFSCKTDEDCGDTGDRVCETWTDAYGTSQRCRYKACDSFGNCPSGQACFKGECMVGLPCEGRCEAGTACVPSTGRCQAFACPASCPQGFIATFKDTRDIWDTCNRPAQACECAELPGLVSTDLGRFSSMAADTARNEIFVSSYDGQFGDLVVFRYDGAGNLVAREYVDGVPTSGQVKYGPSGPRGGITEPGDDVGRYTDIAVHGGRVYVSYYDVTNGDLKLAVRSPEGTWTKMRVDGANADLGLHSSLAMDADGLPGIAYYQRSGADGFNVSECPAPAPTGEKKHITALKLARATSATPGASDFNITTLACQSRPAPPCQNCNGVCADSGSGPACHTIAQGCAECASAIPGGGGASPSLTATQTCVNLAGKPTCVKQFVSSNLLEVSDGVGLFPALAFRGKEAVVAFMGREAGNGNLFGMTVSGSGARSQRVLLDASGDTGFFPDVKVDGSGKVLVSYQDFTSRALKLYSSNTLSSNVSPEIIDSGRGPDGSGEASWVGADSSLAVGPDGRLVVVYQDSTGGDLRVAVKGDGWQKLPPIRTEGAVGFFADAQFVGTELFVSHARIRARSEGGEPKVDNSLLLEKLKVP